MESKIFIDINYASRSPQIVIRQKDSEDPRDKLVVMLLGEAMPGVRDGFCRIERYQDQPDGVAVAIITPVHPLDMVKHIPQIAEFAEKNPSIDTSGMREHYLEILETELHRVSGLTIKASVSRLKTADDWAVKNLPPDLYKRWNDEVIHG